MKLLKEVLVFCVSLFLRLMPLPMLPEKHLSYVILILTQGRTDDVRPEQMKIARLPVMTAS